MQTIQKSVSQKAKRNYSKPKIKKVQIDNQISMIMLSNPGDPEIYSSLNPFK